MNNHTNTKKEWTQDQIRAVNEDGNILVSASAGSGKTTVMIERIMRMIVSGVPLSRILVLVFNNATAIELRQKITKELLMRLSTANDEQREIYRVGLDEIPFAHISTLDSFCLSLVQKNFEMLGVAPNANIADDADLQNYFNAATNEMLEMFAKSDDEMFDNLVSMFGVKRNEEGLLSVILKIYKLKSIQPYGDEFLKNMENSFDKLEGSIFESIVLENQKSYAKKMCDYALNLEANLRQDKQIAKGDMIGKIAGYANLVLQCNSIKQLSAAYNSIENLEKIPSSPKFCDEILSKKAKDFKAFFVKFIASGKSIFSDYELLEKAHKQNSEYFAKIAEAVRIFEYKLMNLMQKDEKFSFNDIEHLAVKLLDSPQREVITNQFDCVFVDEYQDINPMQEFLIDSFVDDRNAFMVGDTKQSIYGFRLADPNIFLGRMEKYNKGYGKNILLNSNFRSKPEILSFVNNIFDIIMTKEKCGIDYKNSARFEIANEEYFFDNKNVQVHLFVEPKQLKSDAKDEVYKLYKQEEFDELEKAAISEGKFIAEKIKSIVGKEIFADGKRKYNYGDIAILYRFSSANTKRVIQTLVSNGIPIDNTSMLNSDISPERELISLLKVVDNPTSDIDLAGFLLSYFGRLTEEDLAKIRIENPEDTLYSACLKYSKLDNELARLLISKFRFIEELRLKSAIKNVKELMESAIFETAYDSYLLAKGGEELASINAFLSSLNGKDYNENIHKFLRAYPFIRTIKSNNSASSHSKVTVKTIHTSKGLEFPVVFLIGIGNNFSTNSIKGDLIVDNEGSVGMMFFDKENRTKSETISHLGTKLAIRARERKEEMRLFYVALTRAKYKLFLTGVCNAKNAIEDVEDEFELEDIEDFEEANSFLQYIRDAISQKSLDKEYIFKHNVDENVSSQMIRSVPTFAEPEKEYVDEIKKQIEFVYAFESSTYAAQKYSVTNLNQQANIEDDFTINLFQDDDNYDNQKEFENESQIDNQNNNHHNDKQIKLENSCSNKYTLEFENKRNKNKSNCKLGGEDFRLRGIAYHKILEKIDYEKADINLIKEQISVLVKSGDLTENMAQLIDPKDIEKCLNSRIIKFASQSKCLREKSFMMYVPLCEITENENQKNITDKVLVQGVIDLLIFDNETDKPIAIVDFKNSYKNASQLKKTYEKQLYLYKKAVESAYLCKIEKLFIYSFANGEAVEL